MAVSDTSLDLYSILADYVELYNILWRYKKTPAFSGISMWLIFLGCLPSERLPEIWSYFDGSLSVIFSLMFFVITFFGFKVTSAIRFTAQNVQNWTSSVS